MNMVGLFASIKTGFNMFLRHSELLPTTYIFSIITIIYTVIKAGYTSINLIQIFNHYPWLWNILQTCMLYFFIFLVLSLTKTTTKLILKEGSFFGSLWRTIIWMVGLYFLNEYYLGRFTQYISYIQLLGSIIWIGVNAIILNGTIMQKVGIGSEQTFSWIKFLLALLIQAGILYLSYELSKTLNSILIYLFYVGLVMSLFLLFIPRKALNTVLYYLAIFAYIILNIYYYSSNTTTSALGYQFSYGTWIQLIVLIVEVLIIFLALGSVGAVYGGEDYKTKNFQSITFFVCYSSFAYSLFEFLIFDTNNLITNPNLYVLELQFIGICATAIVVYIYHLIHSKKVAPPDASK